MNTHKPYKVCNLSDNVENLLHPLFVVQSTCSKVMLLHGFRIPKQSAETGRLGIPGKRHLSLKPHLMLQQQFTRTVEGIPWD